MPPPIEPSHPFAVPVEGVDVTVTTADGKEYKGTSDADGKFEIKGLPAGSYTIEAWHEKLGVHHNVGQAKFLESALNEARRDMDARLADGVRQDIEREAAK